jgi:SAM-dependent methyltransferase
MRCRHCDKELTHTFIDLGSSPLSNSYLTTETINTFEKWYPLKVLVCNHCWLAQTEDFVGADQMFSEDYAYFSSYSSFWLKHAKDYVDKIISRFHLTSKSNVVEVAANDGYLLQYILEKNIPCYGIEPTKSTAMVARMKGIEIIEDFFGEQKAVNLVKLNKQADLIVANNVLAHVPDVNDFIRGFKILLTPLGVATFEFPHLLNLVKYSQFDTIYHEHYSYLSMIAVQTIFEKNGISIFDVEELPTHGGSLRVYAQRSDTGQHAICNSVNSLIKQEEEFGVNTLDFYQGLQGKAETIKIELLEFLIKAKKDNKKVVAYGAAAKGNTIMNFSGIKSDLISYVVDKNPAKEGKYMPGSRIPIKGEEYLKSDDPDYIVILPWNLKDEIISQLDYVENKKCRFVVSIPNLKVI